MSARTANRRADLIAPVRATLRIAVIAVIAGAALSALLLCACDTNVLGTPTSAVCTEAGAQCQLPTGPLGVCERAQCPAGVASPCFECISQH
jgi:hypothetical protein